MRRSAICVLLIGLSLGCAPGQLGSPDRFKKGFDTFKQGVGDVAGEIRESVKRVAGRQGPPKLDVAAGSPQAIAGKCSEELPKYEGLPGHKVVAVGTGAGGAPVCGIAFGHPTLDAAIAGAVAACAPQTSSKSCKIDRVGDKSVDEKELAKIRKQSKSQAPAQEATTQGQAKASQGPASSPTIERKLEYAGYSKRFHPVKKNLVEGKFEEAVEKLPDNDTSFLDFAARGNIALDRGDVGGATSALDLAESLVEEELNRPKLLSWTRSAGALTAEFVTGREDIHPYYGEGFERILLLNLKTVAYLLNGDRRAYNVTRRAIDWQDLERERFAKEVSEAQKEFEKEKKRSRKKGREGVVDEVSTSVEEAYSETDIAAARVASAYVNPFGHYLSGVIHEFESYGDPSLVGNARISYEKAAELNPESPAIREAEKALSSKNAKPPAGLVHVIAFDGFAPEKKVLTYGLALQRMIIPVKIPFFEPVPNAVQTIRIANRQGRVLSTLSPVADIEAIVLRHQKDQRTQEVLRVAVAVGRTYFEKKYLMDKGKVGAALAKIRDDMGVPDTRSWMTLPRRILATRFVAPAGVRTLNIWAYDSRGRKIASQQVKLEANDRGPAFIYVRSIDKTMTAYLNHGLWVE